MLVRGLRGMQIGKAACACDWRRRMLPAMLVNTAEVHEMCAEQLC